MLWLLFIVLALGGVRSLPVHAQNVWANPKGDANKIGKKAKGVKQGVKKWKEHVEQWGMGDDLKHQLSLGGKLNSNGWSGCVYYFKRTGKAKQDIWSLSFSEIKHEKQVKQQRPTNSFPELGEATPFVYGKINNVYTVQLGYSREQMLLPGVVEGNLSVGFRYGGGLSLGLLKPYYLKLIYTVPAIGLKEERYSDSNAEMFLKAGNILGGSKWEMGLEETRVVPGAFAELAFVVTPAKSKFLVQTIMLGTNIAYYSKPLPVMAGLAAYRLQTAVFVGVALGKRW